ncbi:MAG: glycosyltransferase family 4 protein [Desulfomonilaceae bacterium]
MKRIGLSVENFSLFSGGAESYAVQLAQTLERNGWEVHLIGHSWDGNPNGAIFHKIPRLPKLIPPFLRILHFALMHRNLVKRMDLDIVVGFGNTLEMNVYQSHGGVHLVSSLKKLRAENNSLVRFVKKILTFVSPKSVMRAWIESAPFRKKSMPTIIAISDMVRDDICKRYQLSKNQVYLVYNGVNLQRFSSLSTVGDRESFRRVLGFSSEVLFLFMAYDFRKKGVRYLVQAAAKLQDRVGKGKFGVVIVGSTPSPALRRLTEALHLESVVLFNGPTKEPEKFYGACDVFMLPTFYDACSLVVFEAMAYGLPVITTIDNGASGIITDGVDGAVLDDPRGIDQMVSHMERFLDIDFRQMASRNAKNKVSRYSIEANHSRMLAIFEVTANSNLVKELSKKTKR